MSSSFIPPVCLNCGGLLSRKSNTDPTLVCNGCFVEYDMHRRQK